MPRGLQSTALHVSPPLPRRRDSGGGIAQSVLEHSAALVVSDLHLGIAMRNVRDRHFAECLASHADCAAEHGLLILNGDTFDFLRMTAVPETDADFNGWYQRLPRRLKGCDLRSRVGVMERVFGMGGDECSSVWKFHLIALRHPTIFAALAEWILAGGRLAVVKGNHDLEVHWEAVQHAILAEVTAAVRRVRTREADSLSLGESFAADSSCAHGCGCRSSDAAVAAPVCDRVRNSTSFVAGSIRLGKVWVEHGHRFEPISAVRGAPVRFDGTSYVLRLPPGAWIARYFLNHLERASTSVSQMAHCEPERPEQRCSAGAQSFATLPGIDDRQITPTHSRPVSMLNRALDKGEALLNAISARSLAAGAAAIMSAADPAIRGGVGCVIMGHTHVHAVEEWDTPDGDRQYVNTGSWCPPHAQLEANGSVPATHQASGSYARLHTRSNGEYRCELLHWNAGSGAIAPMR